MTRLPLITFGTVPTAAAARGEPLRPYAGIWPELALMNHSCLPNTLALVVGDRLVLR